MSSVRVAASGRQPACVRAPRNPCGSSWVVGAWNVAAAADFGDDPEALVSFSLTAQPGDYAAFAPKVIAAAEAGDRHAQALMQEGAAYYLRALKALDFAPGDPLCLLGGIGPHYARYLPEDHLSGLIAARGTALDGAFHLVCKAAAEEVSP